MREVDPMTQTMTVTTVREHWSETINAVARKHKRVVLEKAGVPVAALVSAEDLERLRRYDQERSERFAILDELSAAFADVPQAALEQEVARALAEVRADRRARVQPAAPTP